MTDLTSALLAAIPVDDFKLTDVDPDWILQCGDFDWPRHVPTRIREVWPAISLESKLVATAMAMEAADRAMYVVDD